MERFNQEKLKDEDLSEYYRRMEESGEKIIDEHYKTSPEEKVVKIVKKKEDKEEVSTAPDYSDWLKQN